MALVRGVEGTASALDGVFAREPADPPGRADSASSTFSDEQNAEEDTETLRVCLPFTSGSLPHTADQRSRSLPERSSTICLARSS
eukprot:scaffold69933_cov25-Tisochrysis_lutea.AAC.8